MKPVITQCQKCGSTNLNDLGAAWNKYSHPTTVICNKCGAKWWLCWYTKEEWEEFINAKESDIEVVGESHVVGESPAQEPDVRVPVSPDGPAPG